MTQWTAQHFSLAELVASKTARDNGIDNTPSAAVQAQLARTAVKMDRIRQLLSRPVRVHSGYRGKALNSFLGGAANSQHMTGHAVDFSCEGWAVIDIAKAIIKAGIVFDQIIFEGTWIHISFVDEPAKNRGEILTAHFKGGKTTYTRGLPS